MGRSKAGAVVKRNSKAAMPAAKKAALQAAAAAHKLK